MKCKHCNGGMFYTRDYVQGPVRSVFNADGTFNEDGFNQEMYTHLSYAPGKRVYCFDCGKYVCPAKDFTK